MLPREKAIKIWLREHYLRQIANEANIHYEYDNIFDFDFKEIEAHVEMYNERCMRLVGQALRDRPYTASEFIAEYNSRRYP